MNLTESIKPLIKYWWVVVLTILVVVVGLAVANKTEEPSWDAATTLISKQVVVGPEEGQDYKYDGFYTVQANQMFSDSIETWLEAPDFVNLVYNQAGITSPQSISALKDRFDFDKVISQSVAVRINAGSDDEAKKMMEAMIVVMKEKTETLLVDKNNKPIFTLDSTPVLVLPHEVDTRLQFGVGLIGAVGLGIFLAYFMDAFEELKRRKN
jgi:capsular polysaccharide biosynthesis protein